MKKLLCLSLLFLGIVFAISVTDPVATINDEFKIKEQFDEFAIKFGKNYKSDLERAKRYQIFKDNLKQIEEYQRLEVIYKSKGRSGITKFADMTEEEFKNTILMPPIKDPEPCSVSPVSETYPSDVPDSFDWRDKGAVTPVKDQGTVGTCWAFSTTGNIEGQWFLAGNPLVALSEEQLNDCDPYDCGVFGGFPCRAMEYVTQIGGLMSEKDYPYCVGTGDCWPCSPPHYNSSFCGPGPTYCNATEYPCKATDSSKFAAKITGYKQYSDPTNETDLASILFNVGPLSICMNAGSGLPPLQFHESGVYDPWTCDPEALDHAVLLVGYGVEKGILSDTPYWLIKNSWGSGWCDGGYFKIIRGDGECGINRWISSAIVAK